ncbi:hypothetical protein SNE35_29830 [Paucibacter sp. R3-3]|uniref:Restriction endonuclease type IV Mrr domain-containing protein n=1 Tax=Roseateles agri TaxID=3098619 RepID=A0ABU5DQY9_9BURK|nr:hypothetical protein [Paucibacter sp. R3-3]MDY0748736.1 hypothetical protein [Paucibacter sp. R3-3]
MSALQPKEGDWEEICRYWMSVLVTKAAARSATFEYYGRKGQRQHGVDLFTSDPEVHSVVAQCKFKGRSTVLTWTEVVDELEKTHGYPGEIDHYVVLTTSPRDRTIADGLIACERTYLRSPDRPMRVWVKYWDDVVDPSFIPQARLAEFFPEATKLVRLMTTPSFDSGDFTKAVEQMQHVIPQWIDSRDLDCFSENELREGFILDEAFSRWRRLDFAFDSARQALAGAEFELFDSDVRALTKTLPASREFADQVHRLCGVVLQYGIGASRVIGVPARTVEVMQFDDKGEAFQNRAFLDILSCANRLKQIYVEQVLGTRRW